MVVKTSQWPSNSCTAPHGASLVSGKTKGQLRDWGNLHGPQRRKVVLPSPQVVLIVSPASTTAATQNLALHLFTDFVGVRFRKNPVLCALRVDGYEDNPAFISNQLILFDFLPDSRECDQWLV